jgi:type I restriction enzyme, S subunit
VCIPPIAEQRRIAAELRDRLATIDEMTRAIETQLEAIEALPAALLRRAFEEIEAA